MATKFYSQIDMQVTPTSSTHVATKSYVDALVAEMKDPKNSARAATTAALDATYSGVGQTLTMNANGALTIDAVSLASTNRVLVKNQAGANRTENGIYTVTTVGDAGTAAVLTRAADFNESADISAGAYLTIEEGTANADTLWVLTTNDPITLDTSLLEFSKLAPTIYTAGNGIDITNFAVSAKLDGTSLTLGVSGLKKTAYTSAITWDGAGPYTFTVTAATHGLGATRNLDVKIYESNNIVMTDIAVDGSGDVTITSNSNFSNGAVYIQ